MREAPNKKYGDRRNAVFIRNAQFIEFLSVKHTHTHTYGEREGEPQIIFL